MNASKEDPSKSTDSRLVTFITIISGIIVILGFLGIAQLSSIENFFKKAPTPSPLAPAQVETIPISLTATCSVYFTSTAIIQNSGQSPSQWSLYWSPLHDARDSTSNYLSILPSSGYLQAGQQINLSINGKISNGWFISIRFTNGPGIPGHPGEGLALSSIGCN